VVLTAMLAQPDPAPAGPATDAIRPAVEEVVRILADASLRGPAHTRERRVALRAVMDMVLDYPDAAQRALGIHWQSRSEAERAEFTSLFQDLVTYSYIVTMEGYAGQTVLFTDETKRDGAVFVLTQLQGKQGPPVPIEYRMHQRGERWLIYDVVVEGVSLVGNYRAQFNTIIRTTSYEELVRRMKARVAELTKPSPPRA